MMGACLCRRCQGRRRRVAWWRCSGMHSTNMCRRCLGLSLWRAQRAQSAASWIGHKRMTKLSACVLSGAIAWPLSCSAQAEQRCFLETPSLGNTFADVTRPLRVFHCELFEEDHWAAGLVELRQCCWRHLAAASWERTCLQRTSSPHGQSPPRSASQMTPTF